MTTTHHLWSRLLDLIAPRSCVVCGRRLALSEQALCSPCLLHLPRTAFQFSAHTNPMAQLFWHLTPVDKAAALFFYEPHSEVARLLYQMKYADRPDICQDMGRLMAHEMQQASFFDGADALLPVPLSPRRHRQRGYNQSQQLARGISHATGIPIVGHALRRQHFHQSQTLLSRQERRNNVDGMFALTDDTMLRHKHIVLVDDVCTTGATLSACASALKDVEGIRLSVLTLGFTQR